MACGVLPFFTKTLDNNWVSHCSPTGGVQRLHIENIYTFDLSENFETLKTSRLFVVCRNGARRGAGGEKVLLGLNLYSFPSIFVSGNSIDSVGHTVEGFDVPVRKLLAEILPADRGCCQGPLRRKGDGGAGGSCSSESERKSALQKHCRAVELGC